MLSALFDTIHRALASIPAHGDHGDDPTADPSDLMPEPPSLSIDADGWIHDERPGDALIVERIPSPRSSALHRDCKDGRIEGVMWHWTATGAGTSHGLAKRISKPVAEGERASSWHIAIARNGTIYQSVPLTRGSWHAGGATAFRFKRDVQQMILAGGGKTGFQNRWALAGSHGIGANQLFCGVELENVGEVRHVNGEWVGWPFKKDGAKSPVVPPEQVTNLVEGRRYQAWAEPQVASATMFLRAFRRWRPDVHRSMLEWGHVDVDPSRKTDPGPAWLRVELPKILDEVFRP